MAGKLPVLRWRATRLVLRPRPGVGTRPPQRLARLLQAATIGVFQREWPREKLLDCCMYRGFGDGRTVLFWRCCRWSNAVFFLVGVNRSGAEWGFQMPPLSRGNNTSEHSKNATEETAPFRGFIFRLKICQARDVLHPASPQAINCRENRQTLPIKHHSQPPTIGHRDSRHGRPQVSMPQHT